jgi:large subunit ribosomal protein L1
MARLSKKQKEARSKVDSKTVYSVEAASSLVKDVTTTKFDASIDLSIRLGVDPKKSESNGKRSSYASSRNG